MREFNAAFKKWFGRSRVVDENGEPLVVYHGSDEDFSSFRNMPTGIYFTSSIEEAGEYAKAKIGREEDLDRVKVYPVYLRIENPYTPEDTADLLCFDAEHLSSKGHDGVIGSMLSNLEGGEVIYYAVFSPSQIKSVHNQGTWSREDPDIRRNPKAYPDYVDVRSRTTIEHYGEDDDIRRSLWVAPGGTVIETEPHEHYETLYGDYDRVLRERTGISGVYELMGFKSAEAGDMPEKVDEAVIKRGAIRLIYDVGVKFSEDPSWQVDLDTSVPRWQQRLRSALAVLGIRKGTVVNIVDYKGTKELPWISFKANPSIAEMAVATATARSAGAVGGRALVPRRVLTIAKPGQSIIDFGSGPKAMHTMMLRDAGLDVTAHDFPANVRQGVHDPNALDWQYDIVMASNVLNVQSSNPMLQETVDQLIALRQPSGVIVANFPESPRKLPGATAGRIEDYFRLRGLQPHRVGGTKQAPVWEIS